MIQFVLAPIVRLDRVREFVAQLEPMLERVAVARSQLAMMAADLRTSPFAAGKTTRV